MILFRLFKLHFLSYIKQEKIRVLLTIISVLIGVSLYVSTRVLIDNILVGFQATTVFVSDKNSIRISSDSGSVSEDIIPTILSIPEVDSVTPISTQHVQAVSGNTNLGYVYVIGLDILAINQIMKLNNQQVNIEDFPDYLGFFQDEPIQAIVSSKLIEESLNAPLRILVEGEYKPIFIKSVLNDNGKFGAYSDYLIVIDIKNFQNLFKKNHAVNQLNLTFNTSDIPKALAKIEEVLPKQYKVTQGNDNLKFAENLTATIRFNFNFINCLTLLVTSIIIYNAIGSYILDRRRDFGIMLMLGANPGTLFLSSLLSSIILAIFCATLGLLIGYLISLISIQSISNTFSILYVPIRATEVQLSLNIIIEVFIIVLSITLAVSILPCWEIFHIPLRQTAFYQTYEERFKQKIIKTTVTGVVILFFSLLCLLPSILKWSQLFIYLSLIGIALSSAFFLPVLLINFLKLIQHFARRFSIEALIAIEHIQATMRKHIIAIAAMSISICLYLSAMIIFDSIQYTATNWLNQVLSADIYIGESNSSFNFNDEYLADDFVDFLNKNTAIEAINFLTHKDIAYQNTPARILGTTFTTIGTFFKIQFIKPMTTEELKEVIADPNNIFVSEHFASQFNLKIGDRINIPGNNGMYTVRIANISHNYTPYQNILIIPNTLFAQLYEDARPQNAMLFLKNPGDYNKVINDIKDNFPKRNLLILHQAKLKSTAENMMKQTFKISTAVVSIILVLTTLTLFNTLEQLILSRRHEFSVFWSLGASDLTMLKMCLWESFIIYGTALLNAIIPTIIVLTIIFKWLDKFIFGAEITATMSYSTITLFILILTFIVLLDGLIPAIKVKKLLNVEGLHYE